MWGTVINVSPGGRMAVHGPAGRAARINLSGKTRRGSCIRYDVVRRCLQRDFFIFASSKSISERASSKSKHTQTPISTFLGVSIRGREVKVWWDLAGGERKGGDSGGCPDSASVPAQVESQAGVTKSWYRCRRRAVPLAFRHPCAARE